MKDHTTMTQEMTKKSLLFFSSICLLAMVSAVGETASSAPRVVSMLVVPTVIIKEAAKDTVEPYRTNISSKRTFFHDSTSRKMPTVLEDGVFFQVFGTENVKGGQQAAGVTNQGMKITAQVEVENEQKTQSNVKSNALGDEKTVPGSSSDTASLNPTCPMTPLCLNVKKEKNDDGDNIKKSSSNVKELDSSPVMAGVEVYDPLKRKSEKQTLGSLQTGSPDLSEIWDEDSGLDMLEDELHECEICGQVLPLKDSLQHLMKHVQELSPLCSPSRERPRSGKH